MQSYTGFIVTATVGLWHRPWVDEPKSSAPKLQVVQIVSILPLLVITFIKKENVRTRQAKPGEGNGKPSLSTCQENHHEARMMLACGEGRRKRARKRRWMD